MTIADENWDTLNDAFGGGGVDNNETVSYLDPSPGTNFGATNPTIAVTKTGVTLLGNGRNRTALDELLDKIPNWIATNTLPADFKAQLDAAVAKITSGMTTLTVLPV